MAKGVSVHIGLNVVDPQQYDGWDGRLYGCVNDANDMEALATGLGYDVHAKLLDHEATADRVRAAIRTAGSAIGRGDTLLVTYSGHGAQVTDTNRDRRADPEADRRDETWVLYDRMLVDDELRVLWASLPAGMRVVVFSDSCHSGTVVRDGTSRVRTMPRPLNNEYLKTRKDVYEKIQASLDPALLRAMPQARITLISGCQDNQESLDGDRNGAFTAALLQTWNKGAFTGTLATLHSKTAAKLSRQTPNFLAYGAADPAFEKAAALRLN